MKKKHIAISKEVYKALYDIKKQQEKNLCRCVSMNEIVNNLLKGF